MGIVMFLTSSPAFSQSIKGTIKDMTGGKPISYVNIGIKEKNFGTVSDSLGNFQLTFTDEHINDTVTFLHVSYETTDIPVKNLMVENDVLLKN